MAFTNVWDDAIPADTQAANLIGQDIRDLKLDTQQRIAAISGVAAARPVDWELGFAGVLYFAIDTGVVSRWSGSAWVDVTADFFQSNYSDSTTGATTELSIAIPANVLAIGRIIKISAQATFIGAVTMGATGLLLKADGVVIGNSYSRNTAIGDTYSFDCTIIITGAATELTTCACVVGTSAGLAKGINCGPGNIASVIASGITIDLSASGGAQTTSISNMIVSVL